MLVGCISKEKEVLLRADTAVHFHTHIIIIIIV